MIRDWADNAVMAKVRAMYGQRLTESDYDQLLQKKTVGEVAAHLKASTYYADNLAEMKEDLVVREQLEHMVRRRTLDCYTRLTKYSAGDKLFLRLYVLTNEIQQLLMAIRLLNSNNIRRYIIELPVHLAKLMSFDLFAVANIRSYDDLLELLERSDYYKILGRFRPVTTDKPVDLTGCEAALLTYYYEQAFRAVEKGYSGETRRELEDLLVFQLDLHNISVIYRMRRYLNAGRGLIEPRVVKVEGANLKLCDALLDAPDIPAMQAILKHTRRYEADWSQQPRDIASDVVRLRQRHNRKIYRFSSHPVVVVISYMAMLDIEINNIINIIEGIRYQLPPADIKKLLAL